MTASDLIAPAPTRPFPTQPPALARRRLRIGATAHESVVSGGRGAGRQRTEGFRRVWAVSGGLRGGGVRSVVTAVGLAVHGAGSAAHGAGLAGHGAGLAAHGTGTCCPR